MNRKERRANGIVGAKPVLAPDDPRNGVACHHMIRDTAVAMCHELYSTLMQRNEWYADWKSFEFNAGLTPAALEKRWVNLHWPKYIEGARAILAQSLAGPMPESLKDSIHEALLLDGTLTRGRRAGMLLSKGQMN